MKYLLDTNVVSDFVRRHPNVKFRMRYMPREQLCVSSVTVKEIEYGLKHNPAQGLKYSSSIHELLRSIAVIPFEEKDARATAQLQAQLDRVGTPIGPYDVMIAGTALVRGLIMVTADVNDFLRVNHLRIENWRAPVSEVREEYIPYRLAAGGI